MATPNNVVAGLRLFKWRGLSPPPYDDLTFDFSHSQAERRYPYIDGAGHDWTGLDPFKLPVRLYFLNSLGWSSGEDIFPTMWERWKTALFDGSSGDLEHPILGKRRARVLGGTVEVKSNIRAGVIVTVQFTDTIDDPSKALKFEPLKIGIQELAAQADADMKSYSIDYPDGQRTDSLLDLMKQLDGAAFSLRLSLEGMHRQALGIIDDIVARVESLNDHGAWALQQNLYGLSNAVNDLAEKAASDGARTVDSITTTTKTTLNALADRLGNTMFEILQLNELLLANPRIPVGSTVRYYAD